MATVQKYGIKYPFSSNNNDELFVDLNETYTDMTKSRVLHVLFTPKGQRLRDPEFGTDLVKYIFNPSDDLTFEQLKNSIRNDIKRYVNNVEFEDISIYEGENDNSKIVVVHYYAVKGAVKEKVSVAVKL
jgi:phage baseplate assembly protein W